MLAYGESYKPHQMGVQTRGSVRSAGVRISPGIPLDVALPLRIEMFRNIYQFFLEKQMK